MLRATGITAGAVFLEANTTARIYQYNNNEERRYCRTETTTINMHPRTEAEYLIYTRHHLHPWNFDSRSLISILQYRIPVILIKQNKFGWPPW
jgi:hypothetical protein